MSHEYSYETVAVEDGIGVDHSEQARETQCIWIPDAIRDGKRHRPAGIRRRSGGTRHRWRLAS